MAQKKRSKSNGNQSQKTATRDSFNNFQADLGLNANNITSGSTYTSDFISKNRGLLDLMYRSSWIIGMAVDAVADDMTQAGIELHTEDAPDIIEKLSEAIEDLQLWSAINNVIKWSRLYGSCLGVLLIDGQNLETPLRIDSVRKGQFKGILPLDRWQVSPSVTDLVQDFGPDMGKPKYYTAMKDSITPQLGNIHYSRVIRMDAIELPHYQKMAENLWGESVIERIYDRLVAFDSTTTGASQLVYKAYLRTIKIEGLRDIISQGGPAYKGLMANMELIRRLQSNEGITLLDAKDEFGTQNYTFAGLDDVLQQFGQQLSGALEVPMVRMFGQSPKGMNATGEADLRNYYDGIHKKQETRLRRPLKMILELVSRSTVGKPLPDGFTFKFRPLWQITDDGKADIALKDAESVGSAYDRGLISQATALKELRQSSQVSGRFSNITDEDINDADPELPQASDLLDGLGAGDQNEQAVSEANERGDAVRAPATKDRSAGGKDCQCVSGR